MENKLRSISRRNFLTVSGAAIAALAAKNTVLAAPGAALPAATARTAKRYRVGLELYSVRSELARDPANTLRAVARMGYEAVEFYAPYFGWTFAHAKEVRGLMDDLGLRCYSTHNPIESFGPGEPLAKAIELNQILGACYLILASAPRNIQSVEDWKHLCGQLSEATEKLQPHGLSAGFHNHQSEWAKLDGNLRVMDFIAANTPQQFVLQLDVGTCLEAGADPVAWIEANPGRIKVAHLKDWAPGSSADEKGYRVLFGEGVSPWKKITNALGSAGGVEFYLLEQEGSRFPELETAERSLEAWKKFRQKA